MMATLGVFRVAFLWRKRMYQTVQQTAEALEIDLNSEQFDFFLKQRERLLEEYQKYLDEPIPEDIDIKDED